MLGLLSIYKGIRCEGGFNLSNEENFWETLAEIQRRKNKGQPKLTDKELLDKLNGKEKVVLT